MNNIEINKFELAHFYNKNIYIGAVGTNLKSATIVILDIFNTEMRIEVNNVCLFVTNFIIKNINDDIVSIYTINNGELMISKGGK